MHRKWVVSKQSLIKGAEDQCVRIAIENAGGYSGLKLQYEAKRDHLTLWREGYTPVYIVDRRCCIRCGSVMIGLNRQTQTRTHETAIPHPQLV
jgi:Zn ribbon nucleic-acid-binding protein